ncbi:MAG TPA: DUF1684 domain-containing protein [Pyrinomonadaceae bacterium]|nr:DUF1684 domain-containing protein [Pyrinomonadaceae bacterium]
MKYSIAFLILAVVVFTGCNKAKNSAPPFDVAAHKTEIEKWHTDRANGLKKEDSWLTLVGLYWLKEGENKFGSAPSNGVVLARGKAPEVAGSFWLDNGHVRLAALPAANVTVDGKPVTNLDLKDDNDDNGPTIMKLGTLIINVLKRGDRIGVRVKDSQSEARLQFKGIEYFPTDTKWRVEARFERYQPAKTIPITNVLGMTDDESAPGALAFEIDGKTYRIDPILEKGETDYFIMLADETTGRETYGAGRYLYVSPPDASGKVIVDFNKLYNPPCAFTAYATCPLPPRQNHLPFRIEAGEKKYAGASH